MPNQQQIADEANDFFIWLMNIKHMEHDTFMALSVNEVTALVQEWRKYDEK